MKIPSLTLCARAAGSRNAALLLYRIRWWHLHPNATLAGGAWTAKAREAWMRETGLSRNQHDRAIASLKALQLIEVRKASFLDRQISFIRLTATACQALGVGHFLGTEKTVFLTTEKTPPYICLEKYSKNKTDCAPPRAALDGDVMTEDLGKPDKRKKRAGTIQEALAAAPRQALRKPGQPADVETVWREAYSAAYKHFVPALTLKQRSQLKLFWKACPPGAAEKVLRMAVADWVGFAGQAKDDAGAFNLPHAPQVGFLLKYAGVAVNAWMATQHAPVVAPETNPVQLISNVAGADNVIEKKATKAEVWAILGMKTGG